MHSRCTPTQKADSNPHRLLVGRSRDVAVVKVTMNFEPNKVNIQKKNCRVEGKETVCINATVCFGVKLKSKEDTVYEAGKCHDSGVWAEESCRSMLKSSSICSLDRRNCTSHGR